MSQNSWVSSGRWRIEAHHEKARRRQTSLIKEPDHLRTCAQHTKVDKMAQAPNLAATRTLMSPPEEVFRQIIQESINPCDPGLTMITTPKDDLHPCETLNLKAILVLVRVNWKIRSTLQACLVGLDRNYDSIRALAPEPIMRLAQNQIGEALFRTVTDITVDGSVLRLFGTDVGSQTTLPAGSTFLSGLGLLNVCLYHKDNVLSTPSISPGSKNVFAKHAIIAMLEKYRDDLSLHDFITPHTAARINQLELSYWQRDTMAGSSNLLDYDCSH